MKKNVRKINLFLSSILIVISPNLNAQKDSSHSLLPSIKTMGFINVFYSYDFNQPDGNKRQDFFFHHNRHNEFNLNMGLLQVEVDHAKYRAKLGFQAGTYANDNYAEEQDIFQNIYQANVGVALNKSNSLWLDAGIFESNLGFESALSIDNWTLSRALSSESSPYYLAGAKLNYQTEKNWSFTALVSNGWQRIQRIEGNSLLSFGSQITYEEKNRFLINWSTFVGTDDPDEQRRMRYFNNFYTKIYPLPKVSVLLGFDHGIQEESKNSSSNNYWYVYTFITQYQLSDLWNMAFRAEYFQDDDELIIEAEEAMGFQTTSISFNLDYLPNNLTAIRLEGRWLTAPSNTFLGADGLESENFFITASIAMKLEHKH